jgi:ACS family allantoate permease-like MFS transporter
MPLGVIDMGCKLIIMNLSDYYRDRTAFGMFAMCLPFTGGMIMLLAPQTNKGVLLLGCEFSVSVHNRECWLIRVDSLIGAAGTGWGLTMASLSGNTVGYTKKATANAVQIIGELPASSLTRTY